LDTSVILLTLASAALHPLWNLLLKTAEHPQGTMLFIASGSALAALTHALIAGDPVLGALSAWPLLLVSAGGQLIYGFGLVATLQRGALSTYYPIIRASPLMIVLIGVTVLGQSYGLMTVAGIGLVLIGAFLLQRQPGRRLLDDPGALGLAVLAMTGTAIYSLADGALTQTIAPSALFFWVQLLTVPGYMALAARYGGRARFAGLDRLVPARGQGWRPWLATLAAPLLVYGSYVLILMAFARGGDVAAVAALRQISIPWSVVLGALVLGEQPHRLTRRLGAASTLAVGIVIIMLA
jgi:drug/metabolite transporter (DMT)-like permease